MIKVLQIGFSDNYGGIEACIMNYYRNIDRTQIQFDFTDIRDKDIAYKDEIISLGGQVHKLKSWSKNPLKGMISLKKLINDNGYDIVHFNMYSIANLFQFLAADRSKVKAWIVHAHTTRGEIGLFKLLLQKLNSYILAGRATGLCACSVTASNGMYRNIPKEYKVTIIHNAVNVQKLSFDLAKRGELRDKYNLENNYVLGHVGRFMPPKNHSRLIDIFKLVHEMDENTRLMLIGDGELWDEVQAQIQKLGLKDAVICTGMIANAYEYYNAFDVFVLPSLFEGLPVVGIEAQVSGLPLVVSSSVTGEMKFTDEVKYLSLSEPDRIWADNILQYKDKTDRHINENRIQQANMDIRLEAKKLFDFYQSLLTERA